MSAEWMVVIDTCGAVASLALARGAEVVALRETAGRQASAETMALLREMLEEQGLRPDSLQTVGVVNGPGTFTGVRVGLSVAKGLSEGLGVRLVTVSRLEVLQRQGVEGSWAVLPAGRGEVFARDVDGREWLAAASDLREAPAMTGDANAPVEGAALVRLTAADAVPLLMERMRGTQEEVALADANYVRDSENLYRKASA